MSADHPPMTDQQTSASGAVLVDVAFERHRQHRHWGEQDLPDGTGPDVSWPQSAPATAADVLEGIRYANARAAQHAAFGPVTWRHVLLEEVAEALAEDDPAKLRAELVQVAAVAVQWVEALDRRTAAATEATS